jgi:hypothetical protein
VALLLYTALRLGELVALDVEELSVTRRSTGQCGVVARTGLKLSAHVSRHTCVTRVCGRFPQHPIFHRLPPVATVSRGSSPAQIDLPSVILAASAPIACSPVVCVGGR